MNSDKAYWEKFYQKKKGVFFPSPFAKFCFKNYITKEDTIIDLGCGNGRDTLYFASKGLNVVGIDQSKSAITNAIQKGKQINLNSKFIIDDFVNFDYSKFDLSPKVFYSRFTIHSVSESAQSIFVTINKK